VGCVVNHGREDAEIGGIKNIYMKAVVCTIGCWCDWIGV